MVAYPLGNRRNAALAQLHTGSCRLRIKLTAPAKTPLSTPVSCRGIYTSFLTLYRGGGCLYLASESKQLCALRSAIIAPLAPGFYTRSTKRVNKTYGHFEEVLDTLHQERRRVD